MELELQQLMKANFTFTQKYTNIEKPPTLLLWHYEFESLLHKCTHRHYDEGHVVEHLMGF